MQQNSGTNSQSIELDISIATPFACAVHAVRFVSWKRKYIVFWSKWRFWKQCNVKAYLCFTKTCPEDRHLLVHKTRTKHFLPIMHYRATRAKWLCSNVLICSMRKTGPQQLAPLSRANNYSERVCPLHSAAAQFFHSDHGLIQPLFFHSDHGFHVLRKEQKLAVLLICSLG